MGYGRLHPAICHEPTVHRQNRAVYPRPFVRTQKQYCVTNIRDTTDPPRRIDRCERVASERLSCRTFVRAHGSWRDCCAQTSMKWSQISRLSDG